MSSKILVLPGDGIGVEVADQAIRVIDKLNELGLDATYEKELVGGASYDANGEPLTSEVLEKAKQSDAILLGAVGGSKWDDVERSKRPEAGLLGLRKELELFANLRPAIVFEAYLDTNNRHNQEMLDIFPLIFQITVSIQTFQHLNLQIHQLYVHHVYHQIHT